MKTTNIKITTKHSERILSRTSHTVTVTLGKTTQNIYIILPSGKELVIRGNGNIIGASND